MDREKMPANHINADSKRGNEFTLPLIRTVGMLKRLFVFTVALQHPKSS